MYTVTMYTDMYTVTMYTSCYLPTEQDIALFVSHYKTQFPTASVFPKLHILEKHTIPWLRKWGGVGFGLMESKVQNPSTGGLTLRGERMPQWQKELSSFAA